MEFERIRRFERAYRSLTPRDRKAVSKALGLLRENPFHPSLGTERIKGTSFWAARATRNVRLTFEWRGPLLILRNVGRHDETLANP